MEALIPFLILLLFLAVTAGPVAAWAWYAPVRTRDAAEREPRGSGPEGRDAGQ